MPDYVDSRLFKNVSFMQAFDESLKLLRAKGKLPEVSYKGQTWYVLDRPFVQNDKKINVIVSLFKRILHFLKKIFVKGYATNFKKNVELFKKEFQPSTTPSTAKKVEKVVDLPKPLPETKPVTDTSITKEVEEIEEILSPSKEKQERPKEYDDNISAVTRYNKQHLAVAGGKLVYSEKTTIEKEIVEVLKATYKTLEEEILQEGSIEPVRLFQKKVNFMDGLENIRVEFSRIMLFGTKPLIIKAASELREKCLKSLAYDAIVNYNPTQGYQFVKIGEDDTATRLTPVRLSENKLEKNQEIEFAAICERVIKEIATDENKIGRFIKSLYHLFGYAHAHKYDTLKLKLKELLQKSDPADILTSSLAEIKSTPLQEIAADLQLILTYQSTDNYLVVQEQKLVYTDKETSREEREELTVWIQNKVDTLWEIFDKNPQWRGFITHLAEKLKLSLTLLSEDYAEYDYFQESMQTKAKEIEKKIKSTESKIRHELKDGYKHNIFACLDSGASLLSVEKVKKCLNNCFGENITEQAFKFSFGAHSEETMSRGDVYFLLRKISKEIEKIASGQLIEQYCLQAEGL